MPLSSTTDVLRDLLKGGYLINREDVAALSPYMTRHIKRFGDYLIDMETVPNILDDVEALVLTDSILKAVRVRGAGINLTILYNVSPECTYPGCTLM